MMAGGAAGPGGALPPQTADGGRRARPDRTRTTTADAARPDGPLPESIPHVHGPRPIWRDWNAAVILYHGYGELRQSLIDLQGTSGTRSSGRQSNDVTTLTYTPSPAKISKSVPLHPPAHWYTMAVWAPASHFPTSTMCVFANRSRLPSMPSTMSLARRYADVKGRDTRATLRAGAAARSRERTTARSVPATAQRNADVVPR